MEFEASVEHQGYLAKYRILPEQKNIFLAELTHYSGSTDYNPPPSGLVIIKGVRKWLGSIDSHELVENLGEAIALKMASEDYIGADSLQTYVYQNRYGDEKFYFGQRGS